MFRIIFVAPNGYDSKRKLITVVLLMQMQELLCSI